MKNYSYTLIIICFLGTFLHADLTEGDYDKARQSLVETIKKETKNTNRYLGRETLDKKVINALGKVKRHKYVPENYRVNAYDNRPLPIGHGQTISQPYIVAAMTELLDLKESDRVLEVGTGSGYQAAVLAHIVKKVYTLEVIEPLGLEAKKRLEALGYKNIEVQIGDGYYGLKNKAPFDAIIVTAAAGQIPPPLIKQLKPGGKMVIPVGESVLCTAACPCQKGYKGKNHAQTDYTC